MLGNKEDFFLDFAMPWDVFAAETGITSIDSPFNMFIATSGLKGGISGVDGDIDGYNGLPGSGELLSETAAISIPEPAVATLIAGTGIVFLAGRRIFKK